MGTGRLERVEHLLHAELEKLGELRHGRRPPPPGGQLLFGLLDLQRALLRPAWDVDRPAEVAEVALQLAEDGRNGERRERGAAIRLKAVDCLHQAETRHLEQILVWL